MAEGRSNAADRQPTGGQRRCRGEARVEHLRQDQPARTGFGQSAGARRAGLAEIALISAASPATENLRGAEAWPAFCVATMPVPGHVAPIAPVVRALVEPRPSGHLVHLGVLRRRRSRRPGAGVLPDTFDARLRRRRLRPALSGRVKYEGLQKLIFDFEHVFVGSVEGYVTDLRALIDSNHPDALVVDPAVAAGWVITETDGLPTATINVTVLSLEDPASHLRARPATEQFAARPGAQQGALRAGGPGDLRQGESRLPTTGPRTRLAGVPFQAARHALVVPAAIGAGPGVPPGRAPPAAALHRPAAARAR